MRLKIATAHKEPFIIPNIRNISEYQGGEGLLLELYPNSKNSSNIAYIKQNFNVLGWQSDIAIAIGVSDLTQVEVVFQ